MMSWLISIWNFLGRASLTFYLLLGLVADLYIGFFLFRGNPDLFGPLNRLMLLDWICTYGWYQIHQTWWFFLFLILMFLLVVNTCVCTLDKVLALCKSSAKKQDRLGYILRFSPHVMHLAFIMILIAQLTSYVVGVNDQNNILRLKGSIQLPDSTWRLRLDKIEVDFYEGDRLDFYCNRAIDQRIRLSFIDDQGKVTPKVLSINGPVWHQGYSIHLKRFSPDTKGRKRQAPYVNLIIRKDPGIRLFFLGTAVFVVGLLAYLWQTLRGRRREAGSVPSTEVLDAAS